MARMKRPSGVRQSQVAWTALAVILLAASTACGSTSRMQSATRDGNAVASEFSVEPSTDTSSLVEGELGAPAEAGAAGTTAAGVQTTRSGNPVAGNAPAGGVRGRHPGVSTDRINIGYLYNEGSDQFGSALGLSSSQGDAKRQIEAVVRAVNDGGGIAGRQIRLFTFAFRVGQPIDSQMQAACDHFTLDNKTFVVSGNAMDNDVLKTCLGSRGVAYVDHVAADDDTAQTRYPNISYAPGTLSPTLLYALKVDALVAAGWFGKNPVIGVHSNETPKFHRIVEQAVKPRLAVHGYSVKEELYYRIGPFGPEGLGDYGPAALRFKNSGVTHVINVGAPAAFFASAAESQEWVPKWSVSSDSAPVNWVAAMPARQSKGALGVGWVPSRDVLPANREAPVNTAETRCAGIMRAAGEDTTPTLAWMFQLDACSTVFFLEAALNLAPEISVPGLAAGTTSLGTTFLDPTTWRSRYRAPRLDGLGAYRMYGYVDACGCYKYTSPLQSVP